MSNICRQIIFCPEYLNHSDLLSTIDESVESDVDVYVSLQTTTWDYTEKRELEYDYKYLYEKLIYDYADTVKVLWDSSDREEQTRTKMAQQAKADGYTWMLIQDCDESVSEKDTYHLSKTLNSGRYDNTDILYVPWYTYWKNRDTIIADGNKQPIIAHPQFAMNLGNTSTFRNKRDPNGNRREKFNDIFIDHYSFVLSDEECWKKITSWGHSHEFDTKKWYEEKWLAWDEDNSLNNLHPTNPSAWPKAICRKDVR